jgi:hypothetical protein
MRNVPSVQTSTHMAHKDLLSLLSAVAVLWLWRIYPSARELSLLED